VISRILRCSRWSRLSHELLAGTARSVGVTLAGEHAPRGLQDTRAAILGQVFCARLRERGQ
jgi:hypothetical protein